MAPRKKQRTDNSKSSSGANVDDGGGGDGVHLFRLLNDDTRLKIFQYLNWQDLAAAAPTSKGFREDCSHPSLAQNQDRQLTVTFHSSIKFLCRKLVELHCDHRFDTYSRLKVVWRGLRLTNLNHPFVDRIRGGCKLTGVTDLELSFEPNHDDCLDDIRARGQSGSGPETLIWIILGQFLPNLRILVVPHSHNNVISTCAPRFISYWQGVSGRRRGRQFDTLVFRNQSASIHLRGEHMGRPVGLRSIDLDDCIFNLTTPEGYRDELVSSQELFSEENTHDVDRQRPAASRCIFQPYVTILERVSIHSERPVLHGRHHQRRVY